MTRSRSRHESSAGGARTDDAQDLLDVQETLRGSDRAFANLVTRYTPLLYSLALRMLDDTGEADEAVQEILLKVYRGLGRFQLTARFHPWLYTIALNHLRSQLRSKRWQTWRQRLTFDEWIQTDAPHAATANPADATEAAAGERIAAEGIRRLQRPLREVFVLRQVQGLSVRQVAEVLRIPEGTVKTRLFRARRALIDLLTEWE